VIELDAQGIMASSQSACRSDADEESYVIAALRRAQQPPTQGSIRFTMGRSTTKSDVERTVKTLVEIVNKIRNFEKHLKN
jgi:cysteine desulfurase